MVGALMTTAEPPAGRDVRPLRGRVAERAVLDGLVDAARDGRSGALVLRGEAGIGKTALIDHAVARATATDMVVLRAGGVESEMELAYATLHAVCAPIADDGGLERLPEPQRAALQVVFGLSAGAAPDRFLVGLGVLSLLADAAERQPLLVVVDDAQWLDEASALTLAFVARRLTAERVTLLLAARATTTELMTMPWLEVEGLGDADAQALLRGSVPFQLDPAVRDRIVAETGGNPLALLELPRGLSATQLAGGFAPAGRDELAGRIEASFARRLEALDDPARRLLLLAAAEPLGDPALLWRAGDMMGLPRSAAQAAADQGLLTLGERVAFTHPLVRSAVYGTAEPDARRAAHATLAAATDAQTDPDRRAWHLAAAAVGADEPVAEELERSAARAQARGGFSAAAAFLRKAYMLTADPERRAGRALAAAGASLRAGAFDEARALITAATELAPGDPYNNAQAELLRGQIALYSELGRDAIPPLLRAAARLPAAPARDTYLDAWGAAFVVGPDAEPGAGLREIARAARAAPRPDADDDNNTPRTAADVLLDALSTLVADGRATAAHKLERALATLEHTDLPPEDALRWGWLTGAVGWPLWDDERVLALCTRFTQVARDAGALAGLEVVLNVATMAALRTGDLRAAQRTAAEVESINEVTGAEFPMNLPMALATYRGQEAAAQSALDAVRETATRHGQGGILQGCDMAEAQLRNAHGRYDQALQLAQRAVAAVPEMFMSTWAALEALEAATRLTDDAAARDALAHIQAATEHLPGDAPQGILARSRALAATGASGGDDTAAEALYAEAIERLQRTAARPDLARAQLLYGEWLRRRNRRVDARAQLSAAEAQCAALGMDAFAERARRELKATGEHVRGKNDIAARDDLTAQELQIAELAREGLSNPEIGARLFLSPRTVEWHLRKVFTKLGIRSRRELHRVLDAARGAQEGCPS